MAQFSFKSGEVNLQIAEQKKIQLEMQMFIYKANYAKNNLGFTIASQNMIEARLTMAIQEMREECRNISDMTLALQNIEEEYTRTEVLVYDQANGMGVEVQSVAQTIDAAQENPKESNPDNSFLSFVKALLTWAKKTGASNAAGITKNGISYLESLYNFLSGDKKGLTGAEDLFDLGDKSIGVWTGLYDYLKEFYNGAGNTFTFKNQKNVAGVGVVGNIFGFISSVFGAVDTINNTEDIGTARVIGEVLGCGDSVVDMWSSVEELKHVGDTVENITTKGESGVYSSLSFYSAIAKGYTDAVAQGFKSYEKYVADGVWDWSDTARTGIESSVSGLYSMVDSLSFGLISEKTTGLSAEDISAAIENWSEVVGIRAGNYILNDPNLYGAYNNYNSIGRVAIICYAVSKL